MSAKTVSMNGLRSSLAPYNLAEPHGLFVSVHLEDLLISSLA